VTAFLRDESGQDMIEYALVMAVIAITAMWSFGNLTNSIGNFFNTIGNAITGQGPEGT
jgi:pilus assembly protein Flp/PilA